MKYTWDRRDYEPASYFCDGIWMEDKAVCDRLNEQDTTLAAAHAENERLRGALEFYADKKTWTTQYECHSMRGEAPVIENFGTFADHDKGDVARQALAPANSGEVGNE